MGHHIRRWFIAFHTQVRYNLIHHLSERHKHYLDFFKLNRQVEVPYINDEDCSNAYGSGNIIGDVMICAGEGKKLKKFIHQKIYVY